MFSALLVAAALAACSPATEPVPQPPAESAGLAAAVSLATVSAPLAGARVTSPLPVTGIAPANWYFENQFPLRLLDAQGVELAMAPATPRVNWTENAEPKAFDAELLFSVTAETPATLVLQEDMPREGEAPREVRVALTLMPSR